MHDTRESEIVDCLVEAFSDLMEADPDAFRTKFRKMAADPFAFYRGSACVFYADVANREDPWADERTSRVWIQGDLHAENFGTYMDGAGKLIFDVNDFDEAFVGHFTWDLQRFAASIALMCWQKALSDEVIRDLITTLVEAYLEQVRWFLQTDDDSTFSLNLETARGAVKSALEDARLSTRAAMLDRMTRVDESDRRFRESHGVRRLDKAEYAKVNAAFEAYQDTIPKSKRFREVAYDVKDIVGRTGFGIGSAGLPSYNVLVEGFNQALDNDIVLSMKQGNVAAPSRVVDDEEVHNYFKHHGHRTAVSQRALQAHADPLLGYTEIDGTGFVVAELSPYEADLDWTRTDRTRRTDGSDRTTRPCGRQGALRRRRRQRPGSRQVPNRGRDRRGDRGPRRRIRRRHGVVRSGVRGDRSRRPPALRRSVPRRPHPGVTST